MKKKLSRYVLFGIVWFIIILVVDHNKYTKHPILLVIGCTAIATATAYLLWSKP